MYKYYFLYIILIFIFVYFFLYHVYIQLWVKSTKIQTNDNKQSILNLKKNASIANQTREQTKKIMKIIIFRTLKKNR